MSELKTHMNEMVRLVEKTSGNWPVISRSKAQILASVAGVRLPRIGREVTLGSSDEGTVWLQNQSGKFHIAHFWRR